MRPNDRNKQLVLKNEKGKLFVFRVRCVTRDSSIPPPKARAGVYRCAQANCVTFVTAQECTGILNQDQDRQKRGVWARGVAAAHGADICPQGIRKAYECHKSTKDLGTGPWVFY